MKLGFVRNFFLKKINNQAKNVNLYMIVIPNPSKQGFSFVPKKLEEI